MSLRSQSENTEDIQQNVMKMDTFADIRLALQYLFENQCKLHGKLNRTVQSVDTKLHSITSSTSMEKGLKELSDHVHALDKHFVVAMDDHDAMDRSHTQRVEELEFKVSDLTKLSDTYQNRIDSYTVQLQTLQQVVRYMNSRHLELHPDAPNIPISLGGDNDDDQSERSREISKMFRLPPDAVSDRQDEEVALAPTDDDDAAAAIRSKSPSPSPPCTVVELCMDGNKYMYQLGPLPPTKGIVGSHAHRKEFEARYMSSIMGALKLNSKQVRTIITVMFNRGTPEQANPEEIHDALLRYSRSSSVARPNNGITSSKKRDRCETRRDVQSSSSSKRAKMRRCSRHVVFENEHVDDDDDDDSDSGEDLATGMEADGGSTTISSEEDDDDDDDDDGGGGGGGGGSSRACAVLKGTGGGTDDKNNADEEDDEEEEDDYDDDDFGGGGNSSDGGYSGGGDDEE